MTPQQQLEEEWHKDPKNWIWGIFYYNKADKRIFPPKRTKWMGWTINFAQPQSVLALLLMLAFFGFVIYMIENHRVN